MKRKNPDFNKARKFIRKAKFSENLLSTSYLYIKLFFLWFLVVISDFLIEFRFEYLWPFYLCVRNVYDIFKYQGFAFSAFFVFITLTSNAICFFVMPVQWLFFTASTYVWFQYVWNSEKGICLQTFTVWLIFVYVEATVRLKELKNMPTHLDLCRPMAAHVFSYPFVSLGFGIKKYLNNQIMLRRQKEVQAENEKTFYTINRLHIEHTNDQLIINKDELQQANRPNQEELNNNEQLDKNLDESDDEKRISSYCSHQTSSNIVFLIENIFRLTTIYLNAIFREFISLILFKNTKESTEQITTTSTIKSVIESSSLEANNNINITNNNSSITHTDSNHHSSYQQPENSFLQDAQVINSQDLVEKIVELNVDPSKENKLKKLKQENKNEIKKLKADLQLIRQSEIESKDKLNKMQVSRNEFKFQCSKLQHDNTALQTKLQNFLNAKQQDKNTISELEKKLQEERKVRSQLEKQLNKYSKVVECGETCKQKRIEFDDLLSRLREETMNKEMQIMKLIEDRQKMLTAIDKMQDRNQQLELNLKEETKLKLELFSVLGETRRQLEMNQILLFQKSNEVEELNSKISELMAISGHDPFTSSIFLPNFISANNNELNKQQQSMDSGVSNSISVLKNSIQQSNVQSSNNSNNIQQLNDNSQQQQQQQQSEQSINLNNSTNNCNINNKTSLTHSNIKGSLSLSDWKNLNHSLESTSSDLTPKSSTSDL